MKTFKYPACALVVLGLLGGGALTVNSGIIVSAAMAAPPVTFNTEADMQKLIGRNIKSAAGDTVGEVKSVMVGKSGRVSSVIVGVGGFLGVGDHEVAISWNDIQVLDEGKTVLTTMTKDELKALPEYKYKQAKWRGSVFHDEL